MFSTGEKKVEYPLQKSNMAPQNRGLQHDCLFEKDDFQVPVPVSFRVYKSPFRVFGCATLVLSHKSSTSPKKCQLSPGINRHILR